ncbi:unnamed protein product [Polarella glacialis]|uniref:Uncharacterized protein n=1 Tax=Polarella glacialis TaxID=89957 RepID=A0A813DWY3_POLGL|nr:unnamed protein product [Polarella glacialis]
MSVYLPVWPMSLIVCFILLLHSVAVTEPMDASLAADDACGLASEAESCALSALQSAARLRVRENFGFHVGQEAGLEAAPPMTEAASSTELATSTVTADAPAEAAASTEAASTTEASTTTTAAATTTIASTTAAADDDDDDAVADEDDAEAAADAAAAAVNPTTAAASSTEPATTTAEASTSGPNTTTAPASTTTAAPSSLCTSGAEIQDSNRTGTDACFATQHGDECVYQCNEGYIPVGRHVCQTIIIRGKTWKENAFFGGECYRLCSDSAAPCPVNKATPIRVNSFDEQGNCLRTKCMHSADEALRNLARGNYEIWRLGRASPSGMYQDSVHLNGPQDLGPKLGGLDMTGIGLIMECVADAMGWIDREELLSRLGETLSSLDVISHAKDGWLPRFVELPSLKPLAEGTEGSAFTGKTWSVMSTGIVYAGIYFVKTYLQNVGTSGAAGDVVALAEKLTNRVNWRTMMCLQKFGSPDVMDGWNGTGIPMLQTSDGECISVLWPSRDGYYEFNEEITASWIAFEKVCGEFQRTGYCAAVNIQNMWNAVQGRRFHPDSTAAGYEILTKWSAYVVQIPYYMVHAVNSDATYQKLFKNQWLADWATYNSSVYYGDSSRYGVGAGPDMTWCSGAEYLADKYEDNPDEGDCRTWSPHSVAGYLPVEPETIKGHLLQMLANGEATMEIPGTDYHVLWRKSMIDPTMNWTSYITLVDLAGELWGLSTIWLGADFYVNNTNHFTKANGFYEAEEGVALPIR